MIASHYSTLEERTTKNINFAKIMYGLQNTYVSGGWGEGGGSSLAWTEDDERTVSFEKRTKKRFCN